METVEELPRTLELGSSPAPGVAVTAVGYPGGGAFTMAPGRVLGYVPGTLFGEAADTMVISNRVEPGNSGGPLLDIAHQRGFFGQPPAC